MSWCGCIGERVVMQFCVVVTRHFETWEIKIGFIHRWRGFQREENAHAIKAGSSNIFTDGRPSVSKVHSSKAFCVKYICKEWQLTWKKPPLAISVIYARVKKMHLANLKTQSGHFQPQFCFFFATNDPKLTAPLAYLIPNKDSKCWKQPFVSNFKPMSKSGWEIPLYGYTQLPN